MILASIAEEDTLTHTSFVSSKVSISAISVGWQVHIYANLTFERNDLRWELRLCVSREVVQDGTRGSL